MESSEECKKSLTVEWIKKFINLTKYSDHNQGHIYQKLLIITKQIG